MKTIILVSLLMSTSVFASDVVCFVDKTLLKWNAETQKLDVKKAVTSAFVVTQEPHEEPKILILNQSNGEVWGQVSVTTGSYVDTGIKSFYANATVLDINGYTIGYLTLKSPVSFAKASAMTMINDNSEAPPTMSIECKVD